MLFFDLHTYEFLDLLLTDSVVIERNHRIGGHIGDFGIVNVEHEESSMAMPFRAQIVASSDYTRGNGWTYLYTLEAVRS